MAEIALHNQTSSTLNVAFSVSTPLAFHNEVQPDQTIRLQLATFAHHFEARIDSGGNRFSSGESWRKISEIGIACPAGSAAVGLGTRWFSDALKGRPNSAAFAAAGAAWGTAHHLGAQYGQPGENAVIAVPGVWIPFHEKHYSLREIDNKFVLWDDDENQEIG